jgi:hypothetical protein
VLQQLGFTDDYTTFPLTTLGYRNGLAIPFKWFDVTQNLPSHLRLHPTHAMDRTLKDKCLLTSTQAASQLNQFAEAAQRYNLRPTYLIHNEILANYGEWQGWQPLLAAMQLSVS